MNSTPLRYMFLSELKGIAEVQTGGSRSATSKDIIPAGAKVARLTWRDTHKGEFQGVPPTNKQIEFTTMEFFRVADGTLAEHWDEVDLLGMLQRIGAISAILI